MYYAVKGISMSPANIGNVNGIFYEACHLWSVSICIQLTNFLKYIPYIILLNCYNCYQKLYLFVTYLFICIIVLLCGCNTRQCSGSVCFTR